MEQKARRNVWNSKESIQYTCGSDSFWEVDDMEKRLENDF